MWLDRGESFGVSFVGERLERIEITEEKDPFYKKIEIQERAP